MEQPPYNLQEKLLRKSEEAFVMALEIYNKPTLKYRIEGFSFFICNAWELMLKSKLLNDNKSIYYKDNARTYDLSRVVRLVYSDKRQPLRINLEEIIKLRNTSTHFITEDYETVYVPLFQSCVLNFSEQIKRFHKVDLTELVTPNFLTLSPNIDILTNEEIRGKYSVEMAERLIKDKTEIAFLMENNRSTDFFIPIRHEFYQTRKKDEADFTYRFDKDSSAIAKTITTLKDPNDKYKLSFEQVVTTVNKQLEEKKIKFDYISGKGERLFNAHTLTEILRYYNLKEEEKYCFKFAYVRRYSQQTVGFIIDLIKNDSDVINSIKKATKKR